MSDPFKKVRSFLAAHRMLCNARGIVVAVSGGADSVALLDMLARIEEDPSFRPAPPLYIAHLDHQLRGRESAEDADFVRSLAEQRSIPAIVEACDLRAAASRARRGIEEVAREIRYKFLLAAAEKAGADRIATGHTMNDQAETFLMRLARGAGLRGLAAMRPVTRAHAFDEAYISNLESQISNPPLLIRPLLCLTRDEVEHYCRERALTFRTDATNLSLDYTRNRVRHVALPALTTVSQRAVEQIARAAEIIAADQDALDHYAALFLDEAAQAEGAYSVPALLKQAAGLRRRMILRAIERARAAACHKRLPASAQITSAHVAAVERLLCEGASGARVVLPGGLEAWREFDLLVFKSSGAPPDRPCEAEMQIELQGARAQAEAGGIILYLLRGQPRSLLAEGLKEARRERERRGRDWMMAVLDDSSLPERLIVRARLAGERARVAGQSGTKKLKNLMIDHRIPTSRRATWPVVATPDGKYVWSPGLPPAVEFAAHDESNALAILRASEI